jgi:hypothetical protein
LHTGGVNKTITEKERDEANLPLIITGTTMENKARTKAKASHVPLKKGKAKETERVKVKNPTTKHPVHIAKKMGMKPVNVENVSGTKNKGRTKRSKPTTHKIFNHSKLTMKLQFCFETTLPSPTLPTALPNPNPNNTWKTTIPSFLPYKQLTP